MKLVNAINHRLFESLEGHTEWEIDSTLLTWLLSHTPKEMSIDRLSQIIAWFKRHDEGSDARTQYLTFLKALPESFNEVWKEAAIDTADWLKLHEHNSNVRIQYLTFIKELPAAFEEQRKEAATDTADWLKRHEHNSDVRAKYLRFLQDLPAAFDECRSQAVIDVSDWLKRHDEDASAIVRAQYLTFVQSLGEAFNKERIEAALATSEWLDRHPDSLGVISRYVSFILDVQLPQLDTLRQSSDKFHARLIQKEPNRLGNYLVYGEQLRRQSRYDEAITQFEVVIARNNEHQLARGGRAMALQGLGRMAEAEEEFKQALSWARFRNGILAPFHTSLGEFYLATNLWLDAIKCFQDAQKDFPEHYRNYWGIAKAQLGLGDLDKAKKALQRALEDPRIGAYARDQILQLLEDVRHRIGSDDDQGHPDKSEV